MVYVAIVNILWNIHWWEWFPSSYGCKSRLNFIIFNFFLNLLILYIVPLTPIYIEVYIIWFPCLHNVSASVNKKHNTFIYLHVLKCLWNFTLKIYTPFIIVDYRTEQNNFIDVKSNQLQYNTIQTCIIYYNLTVISQLRGVWYTCVPTFVCLIECLIFYAHLGSKYVCIT
jgi:hypothetical protein